MSSVQNPSIIQLVGWEWNSLIGVWSLIFWMEHFRRNSAINDLSTGAPFRKHPQFLASQWPFQESQLELPMYPKPKSHWTSGYQNPPYKNVCFIPSFESFQPSFRWCRISQPSKLWKFTTYIYIYILASTTGFSLLRILESCFIWRVVCLIPELINHSPTISYIH